MSMYICGIDSVFCVQFILLYFAFKYMSLFVAYSPCVMAYNHIVIFSEKRSTF